MVIRRRQGVPLGRDYFMSAAVASVDAGKQGVRAWGVKGIENAVRRMFEDVLILVEGHGEERRFRSVGREG